MTRVYVRLLGPCFKTGRVGYRPTRRSPSHTHSAIGLPATSRALRRCPLQEWIGNTIQRLSGNLAPRESATEALRPHFPQSGSEYIKPGVRTLSIDRKQPIKSYLRTGSQNALLSPD